MKNLTYAEILQKQKRIKTIQTKLELLRAEAEGITQKLSPTPSGGRISDKVGNSATLIYGLTNEIDQLDQEIKAAINSLPDSFEGNCIKLRIRRHYTWRKLSFVIGGANTPDSIKKMCYRYRW